MENIWLSITKPGKMYPQLMYHTIRQMKSPKFVSVFSRKTPCLVMSDKHAFQTIKVICTSVIDIHLFGFVCNYTAVTATVYLNLTVKNTQWVYSFVPDGFYL